MAKVMKEIPHGYDEAKENPSDVEDYADHELDAHADTLQRAAEIQNNPKLMKALGPHLNRKVNAVKSLKQLRAIAQKKILDEKTGKAS